MDILTINSKAALLEHKFNIEILFLECFGDRLSLDLWNWAYIDNPNGEPLVSLCYDGERLVGHYAMVPLPVSGEMGTYNSYLSMTTMVAATHRQHGLFVKLAGVTNERAIVQDIDFVMGFPNPMSTPGFRKKLGWDLPPTDYVVKVEKSQLLNPAVAERLAPRGRYALDLTDETLCAWRLAKPGMRYIRRDGIVYKEFEGGVDLIYFAAPEALDELPDGCSINLLVPHDFGMFEEQKVFEYQFGGLSLKRQFIPDQIDRQMCLSDVF